MEYFLCGGARRRPISSSHSSPPSSVLDSRFGWRGVVVHADEEEAVKHMKYTVADKYNTNLRTLR